MAQPARKQRILIAGMHGFLGSHIAVAAELQGLDVVGLSLQADIDRGLLINRGAEARPEVVAGDATDSSVIAETILQYSPDVFVNAVGTIRSSSQSWLGGYSVNVASAFATVDAIASTEPSRRPFVIWIGSQAEYGLSHPPWTEDCREQPSSAYGVSKLLGTSTLLAAKRSAILKCCVVRLPIVFGPGQAPQLFVPAAIASTMRGEPFPMSPGEQRRRFVYAPDVAQTVLSLAYRRDHNVPILNAPAYAPITMREVAEKLAELLPQGPNPRIGEIGYRPHERMDEWPDTTLAESLDLGSLTPIDTALSETVAWYGANSWFLEAGEKA